MVNLSCLCNTQDAPIIVTVKAPSNEHNSQVCCKASGQLNVDRRNGSFMSQDAQFV